MAKQIDILSIVTTVIASISSIIETDLNEKVDDESLQKIIKNNKKELSVISVAIKLILENYYNEKIEFVISQDLLKRLINLAKGDEKYAEELFKALYNFQFNKN